MTLALQNSMKNHKCNRLLEPVPKLLKISDKFTRSNEGNVRPFRLALRMKYMMSAKELVPASGY
jgi:hypothetical protein